MSQSGPKWAIFEVIVMAGGAAVIIMFAAKGGVWQNFGLGAVIFVAVGALALVSYGPEIWPARRDPDRDETATLDETDGADRHGRQWGRLQAFVVASVAAGMVMLGAKGDVWQVIGAGACVFVAAGALAVINRNPKMSPAQERWRKAPYPDAPRTRDEAGAIARRQIELASASTQERRLNMMGVALVILAITLLYSTAAKFF